MRGLIAAALLFLVPRADAQIITVNENLPTTNSGVTVQTSPPTLALNATTYNGTVPTVSLYASSNVVVGNCVLYATGTIDCLGVRLSTTDPAGIYVPYTGATGDVTLGTHKMLAAQFGAGTSPSTNFLFDGLSVGSSYARVTAGTNLAAGYYWGGARGYSLQERYDLTGTPFTLHDELNNVDRFSLDTSGGWYFPGSVTASSFTALGTGFKGALQGNATTATSATTAGTITGNITPAQVDGSTYTAAIALKAPLASPTFTGTVNGAAGVFTGTFTAGGFASAGSIIASSGTFTANGTAQYSVLTSSGILANAGDICAGTKCLSTAGTGATGPAGPPGSPAGTLGFITDNFLGLANGVTKTFTLTYTPSANSENVILDGTLLSPTSDYVLTTNSIALTTAPAKACTGSAPSNCTSSFYVRYSTGASGVNAFILNSSQTVSGLPTFAGGLINSNTNFQSAMPWVASGTFANVSCATFTVLVSSVNWWIEYNMTITATTGHLKWNFIAGANTDFGANYNWSENGINSGGNPNSNPDEGTGIGFFSSRESPGGDPGVGNGQAGNLYVYPKYGFPKQWRWVHNSQYDSASSVYIRRFGGGLYSGASSPTGVQMCHSVVGGTFSGAWFLHRMGSW